MDETQLTALLAILESAGAAEVLGIVEGFAKGRAAMIKYRGMESVEPYRAWLTVRDKCHTAARALTKTGQK